MKSQRVDRVAAALLLESFEDAFLDWLQAFTMPTLVVCGARTTIMARRRSWPRLLPDAMFEEVPGTHMSSVTKPEFGEAIAELPRGIERGARRRPSSIGS